MERLFVATVCLCGIWALGLRAEAAEKEFDTLTTRQQYIYLLESWVPEARQEIRTLEDGTAIYGLAQSGHWYMQAHDTAFCAFAILATDPLTNETRTKMSRREMLDLALAMLRYTLQSHVSSGGTCTDGKSWGHTWISSLGLERMSVGIDALDGVLPDDLRKLYASVCASEADYVAQTPVTAGLTKDNHPESNMWNGAVCVRAMFLNPGHKNSNEWRECAARLFMNSISIPADEKSSQVVDGKRVSEWFVGANMFDSFACNHHGYQNVGYMNITTSNFALLHFSCKLRNFTPPDALYHHAGELWQLEKTCLFPDGRLARVGGDSRIRYCYCQDYALLAWIAARNVWGDEEAESFERGWLRQVRKEQLSNQTDRGAWFMAERLQNLRRLSPLYFLRLEGDKACSLAAGALWHRWEECGILSKPAEKKEVTTSLPSWHDPFHGAWCVRGENRFASWTWRGAMNAGGLCVPLDASDMAEWGENLAGQIWGVGKSNHAAPIKWTGDAFDGGFATCGISQSLSTGGLAEGADNPKVAKKYIAAVALPDDATMVILQRAFVENEVYLRRVRALNLMIPMDVFNDFERKITTTRGSEKIAWLRGVSQTFPAGEWINLDEKLGIVEIYGNSEGLRCVLPAERQVKIGMFTQGMKSDEGFLYCAEIVQNLSDETRFYASGESLFDTAAALVVGDSRETKKLHDSAKRVALAGCGESISAVRLAGKDRNEYFILVNFSQNPIVLSQAQLEAEVGAELNPIMDITLENFPANGVGVWKIVEKSQDKH
ncbi:MAG: hypothetical protein Q4D38_13180 [Planctomycetia bacterium]|nr:hypothetical protein [Planctomycetia bacterium]